MADAGIVYKSLGSQLIEISVIIVEASFESITSSLCAQNGPWSGLMSTGHCRGVHFEFSRWSVLRPQAQEN